MIVRAAGYLAFFTLAASAATVPTAASVDTSPKPGGVYRLKPGAYVQKDMSCGSAPKTAILKYDGRGISAAHTRSCQARVLSRRGYRYTVMQSCTGARAERGQRTTEQQTVTVSDALTFTLQTGKTREAYRYCPEYMLSSDLKRASK